MHSIHSRSSGSFAGLVAVAVCLLLGQQASGIVLHPDGEMPATNAYRPSDGVIVNVCGKDSWWSTGIVIAPNYILTAAHTGLLAQAPPCDRVWLDANTCYFVDDIAFLGEGEGGDLLVARIVGTGDVNDPNRPRANLTDYVGHLYEYPDELNAWSVLGGRGYPRGSTLTTDGTPYGYTWATQSHHTRWAANRVDNALTEVSGGPGFGATYDWFPYTALTADFDGIAEGDSVTYEGCPALLDSGGGLFIKDGLNWSLAATLAYGEREDESWFRNGDDPNILDPDRFGGPKISKYHEFIEAAMVEIAGTGDPSNPFTHPGDITEDGMVDSGDMAIMGANWNLPGGTYTWNEGDLTGDGNVDGGDLVILGANWLYGTGPLVSTSDATISWTGTDDDWSDPSNWSTLTVPDSTDVAYLNNGYVATVSSGVAEAGDLVVGKTTASGLAVSGGTLIVGRTVYVGGTVSGEGTVSLSGGTLLTGWDQYVGCNNGSEGHFTQSGGVNQIGGYLMLGVEAGATGCYELQGGELSSINQYMGDSGEGSFYQTGGTNTLVGRLYIGKQIDGTGRYELSGSTSDLSAYTESFGFEGQGTFVQNGGTNTTRELILGYMPDSLGRYELGGGYLCTEDDADPLYSRGTFTVGLKGTGQFVQTGGSAWIAGVLEVAAGSLSQGTVTLTGGEFTAADEYIGRVGSGVLQQGAGTNNAPYLEIGNTGRYVVTAGGGTVNVGYGGEGGMKIAPNGTWDLGDHATVVELSGGIIDWTEGSIINGGQTGVTAGPNTLIIADDDPSPLFDTYTNNGLFLTPGGTVTIGADRAIIGQGYVPGFVNCLGTLQSRSKRAIHLEGGLAVDGALVDVGDTREAIIVIDGTNSSLTGQGSIQGGSLLITGGGSFSQSSGIVNLVQPESLMLGGAVETHGTYTLSGGILSIMRGVIGDYGDGVFQQSGGSVVVHSEVLRLGTFESGTGTYRITAGTLLSDVTTEAMGGIAVGELGRGTLQVDGGTVITKATSLSVGNSYGGSGLVTFTSGRIEADQVTMAGDATAFLQTGGTHVVGASLRVGAGEYELSGGSLSAPEQTVGISGIGTFTHTGGVNVADASLTLGDDHSDDGTYSLSGGADLSTSMVTVGFMGRGTFTQTGGTHIASQEVSIGVYGSRVAKGTGHYNLSGGLLSTDWLVVGGSGVGRFDWTGGEFDANGIWLGTNGVMSFTASPWSCGGTLEIAGGTLEGTYRTLKLDDGGEGIISGGQATLSNLYVGDSDSAEVTQSDGIVDITNSLHLGYSSGAQGSYTLSGGSLSAGTETVGRSGRGVFSQSGGVHLVDTDIYVGYKRFAVYGDGTYNLSGGYVSADNIYVGSGARGTFTQSGGTATATTYLLVYDSSGSDARYELSGGSLNTGETDVGLGSGGRGIFTQTGGTHQTGGLYVAWDSGSYGSYSLSGGLLTTPLIDGGDGTAEFSFTGGKIVAETVQLDLEQEGGVLAPGDSESIGSCTFSDSYDYTLDADGILEIDIASLISFDTVTVGGDADLAGTIAISLLDYTPDVDDAFDILTADSIVDNGIALGGPDGLLFDYSIVSGVLTLTYVGLDGAPIPEPATMAMLGLGAVAVLHRRRRKT